MAEKINKYSALVLVIFPVLACYNLGGIALYKYLLMLNLIILFVCSIGKTKLFFFPRSLKPFYIYALTVPVIIAVMSGATTKIAGSFLTPILFGLNLILLLPHLRFVYIYKYYRFIIIVACVIFALQELSYYTSGVRFGALIPFLDLYNGIPAYQYMTTKLPYLDRSCSFFVEPSHFAQYLAPYLILELKQLNDKGKLFNIFTIILTLVFVVLRSGNGLFLCAVIWVFAFMLSKMKRTKKLFVLPVVLLVLYIGYGFLSKSEEGANVLDRMEQLDADQDRVTSGTIRIYRGFFVLNDSPLIVKIFGVGAGGTDYIIDNSRYRWMFASENDHYLNNASFFLIAYGFIGTLLFFFFLLDICKKRRFASTILVVAFLALCLMESFVFDPRMLLYISLASMVLVKRPDVAHTSLS